MTNRDVSSNVYMSLCARYKLKIKDQCATASMGCQYESVLQVMILKVAHQDKEVCSRWKKWKKFDFKTFIVTCAPIRHVSTHDIAIDPIFIFN